jgi:uncharacterized protein YdbL (DUF1318 family)
MELIINPTRLNCSGKLADVGLVAPIIWFLVSVLLSLFLLPNLVNAADFKASSPAVIHLKQSMKQRHSQLIPFYDSGAVGLTRNGLVILRNANAVPLSGRQSINALVAAENQDRNALYREIALANNHPEWESDVRATFAQRWVKWARSGWWYQQKDGSWSQK